MVSNTGLEERMADGNETHGDGAGGAERLRVAVLGPGGIGGLVGGLLAREGHEVVCIARAGTAEHLAANGLVVRSVGYGDFTVPVRAATALEEVVDVCFATPKTTQLEEALERVPPAALGGGLVVPLCNGVDHVQRLRERYPRDQVVPATIRVESARVAPGVIEHTSPFAIVEMAPGEVDRGRVERLAAHLASTGLHVAVRDDESAMLWDKLAILGPLALITTVAGAPAGEARTRLAGELRALVDEYVAVAVAEGASVEADAIMSLIARIPEPMKSSMLRDAEAGNPTEIDAIGGEVIHAGERRGIPTPVTDRMVAIIRERERERERAAAAGGA
jgi:2-dehydropantoate 2-reductase